MVHTHGSPPHTPESVPQSVTSACLGRGPELARIERLLRRSWPWITLTGLPGVGLSTLLRQVFTAWSESGAVLLDLQGRSLAAALGDSKPALLFLDHVSAQHREEMEQLASSGSVPCVVAASHVRLGLPSERLVEVGGLESEAGVELFSGHSQLGYPDPAEVRRLVQLLDGHPLALVLAAKQRAFTLSDMIARASTGLGWLTETEPPLRSLERALNELWGELDAVQQQVLLAASAMASGFSYAALEPMLEPNLLPELPRALARLVESGVVRAVRPEEDAELGSLRLLHFLKVYLAARQDLSEQRLAVRLVHARRTLADSAVLLDELERRPLDAPRAARARVLAADLGAVIRRRGVLPLGLVAQAACALGRLGLVFTEIASDAGRLLEEVPRRDLPAAERVELNLVSAELALAQGEVALATAILAESAKLSASEPALAAELRARLCVAQARLFVLQGQAAQAEAALSDARAANPDLPRELLLDCTAVELFIEIFHGDIKRASLARSKLEQALVQADVRRSYLSWITRLGLEYTYNAQSKDAERVARQAIELATWLADARYEVEARQVLAEALIIDGRWKQAADELSLAFDVCKRAGLPHEQHLLRGTAGLLALFQGDLDGARSDLSTALAQARRRGEAVLESVFCWRLAALEHIEGDFERARALNSEAMLPHLPRAFAERSVWPQLWAGLLQLELGELEEARERLTSALGQARACFSVRAEIVAVAALALCHAEPSAARAQLRQLQSRFANLPEASALALQACVHFAALRDPVKAGEPRTALSHARAFLDGCAEDGVLCTTLFGLCFEAMLRRRADALDRGQDSTLVEPPPVSTWTEPEHHLTLDVAAKSFRIDDGQVYELRRRRAPWLVLEALAAQHLGAREPLSVFQLFELGWPGERVAAESAAQRVYWVVSELRRMGVGPFIATNEAGYFLIPELVVSRK